VDVLGVTSRCRLSVYSFHSDSSTPAPPDDLSGGLSELSGKGVCVKRLVIVAVFCALVAFDPPALADQPPANDFAGKIMSNSNTGRVGIGTREPAATLDVYKGEIKMGSTRAACTKTLDGALRTENSKLQFCDGASWRNVSLDKER
jgi:hypothetical protein